MCGMLLCLPYQGHVDLGRCVSGSGTPSVWVKCDRDSVYNRRCVAAELYGLLVLSPRLFTCYLISRATLLCLSCKLFTAPLCFHSVLLSFLALGNRLLCYRETPTKLGNLLVSWYLICMAIFISIIFQVITTCLLYVFIVIIRLHICNFTINAQVGYNLKMLSN